MNQQTLENLYRKFNRRKYVHPDPLEFLYKYPDPSDMEIVALVASALAYGRVKQILSSVSRILAIMGPSPARFVEKSTPKTRQASFSGFRHRFATGQSLSALLGGAKEILKTHGSLYHRMLGFIDANDDTVLPGLTRFCEAMARVCPTDPGHLLPQPSRGSACKRLNLMLRWLVRRDCVDPGGWRDISPAKLIVPLDTHMYRMGIQLGFTSRRQADMKTALEITAGFRQLVPHDPIRYDFTLTRMGIRNDVNISFDR